MINHLMEIIQLDCIDSTNRWVREHVSQMDPMGFTCVSAKKQTAGYGRRGTAWVSLEGNLYFTLFFTLSLECQPEIGPLPQVMALACCQILEQERIYLRIKQPNDLFYEGKKCGGILTEAFELNQRLAVALGLGLNVNQPVQNIDQPAISLSEIAGRQFDLNELMIAIARRFQMFLQIDFNSFKPLIEPYLI